MKTALVLTWEGFQDQEVVYPVYRLQEIFGVDNVHVAANKLGRIHGILGSFVTANYELQSLKSGLDQMLTQVEFLLLPGGVKALEKLRQEKYVIEFIKKYSETGKIIATTCHGAQLLISADVIRGRTIAAYYSIECDVENAGAKYSREPVIVDGNIISSPHYDHMAAWMKSAINRYESRKICEEDE